jgi:hypothetical protein
MINQIEMAGKNVCELGFGGGHTLKEIHTSAKAAFGVEIEETNLANAARLGIPQEQLFSYTALPEKIPAKIDLWVFQDSFEHVLAPADLVSWLNRHSANDARIMMVLPRADSISQTLLGKLWPHKLPDHQFHWSKSGLEQFMQSHGWEVVRSFYPKKFVSINMILRHLILKLGLKYRTEFLSGLFLRFNIGEMGLVFQKKSVSTLKVAS